MTTPGTQVGNYTYTVDEETPYTVQVWDAVEVHPEGWPILHQPHNPNNNNQPWSSRQEAEEWIVDHINTHYMAEPVEFEHTEHTLQAQIDHYTTLLNNLKAEKQAE